MPRSKPQETRRRLRSAVKHADKAVQQLAYIMPFEDDYENWDSNYKHLMEYAIYMQRFVRFVETLLDEEIVNKEVYDESGAN